MVDEKILSHEVMLEKTPNRNDSLKVIVKAPPIEGQVSTSVTEKALVQQLAQGKQVIPVCVT
jgi:uncharacterized protein YggU (UPF0235/DUF167 family)